MTEYSAMCRAQAFNHAVTGSEAVVEGCAGDGTFRKTPDKWSRWKVKPALVNHPVQLGILRNALSMLALRGTHTRCATGTLTVLAGRLVYSTCSLNPVECEAVVLSALRATHGVRLLPAREHLLSALPAELAGCLLPGLTSWRVPSSSFSADNPSWECPESFIDDQIVASMFPCNSCEALTSSLSECVRVLPTTSSAPCGGFFLALFERTCPTLPPQLASVESSLQRLEEKDPTLAAHLQELFGLNLEDTPQRLQLLVSRGASDVEVVILAPSQLLLKWPASQAAPIGEGVPAFVLMAARCNEWAHCCSRWRVCQPAAGSRNVYSCTLLMLVSHTIHQCTLIPTRILTLILILPLTLALTLNCRVAPCYPPCVVIWGSNLVTVARGELALT